MYLPTLTVLTSFLVTAASAAPTENEPRAFGFFFGSGTYKVQNVGTSTFLDIAASGPAGVVANPTAVNPTWLIAQTAPFNYYTDLIFINGGTGDILSCPTLISTAGPNYTPALKGLAAINSYSKFKLVSVSGGSFQIINQGTGACIDVKGASSDPLTPVLCYPCKTAPDVTTNQHWFIN